MSNEKKPFEVEIAEPLTFGGDYEMELFTKSELGGLVNRYFRNIFKDYLGSDIKPNPHCNQYGVDSISLGLYFTPGSDNNVGITTAFESVGTRVNKVGEKEVGRRTAAMLANNAVRQSNMSFSPSQDFIDVIHPLLDRFNSTRIKSSVESYMRSGILTEGVMRADNFSGKMINFVFVECISIDKLINDKLTGGDRKYLYRVVPQFATDPSVPFNEQKVFEMYQIEKLNNAALRKKMEQVGLTKRFDGINVITN